jgi:hypothetical protein
MLLYPNLRPPHKGTHKKPEDLEIANGHIASSRENLFTIFTISYSV